MFYLAAQVNLIAATHELPSISAGGLDGVFRAAQFHFHWGSDDNKGSEHTIDGDSFPLEVRFILEVDLFLLEG